ncbi:DUF368 domain-containing protein [Sediminitomix flava]|uniref:Putative membrane protein n=1 Tax=Sediminitomix flava TaxID=379075 RepID=A0A315ZD10_SEDFL|nr:DUF368 domain-containing protein [Sediminitomix flava]PWJ42728.1 putative membrane protein [Sediminitomix flava]
MKEQVLIYLKGIAMGGADVVPGVSGGTIAFITGIYERLLNAINSVNPSTFQLLLKGDLKAFWEKIDGKFLLPLFAGIATAILSLAKLMKYLLEAQPILLWSFFFGLIIVSAIQVGQQVKNWNITTVLALIVGAAFSFYITLISPAQAPEGAIYTFIAGAVAICAMILPGISGAFILLLMGQYKHIMSAISNFQIETIAIFASGCVVGILSFSKVLGFLFKRFHDATVALLTGFMIGSLNKVWPWKEVVETYVDRHGETKPLVEQNISPFDFQMITGVDNQLFMAIGLCFLGGFLIFFMQFAERKLSSRN